MRLYILFSYHCFLTIPWSFITRCKITLRPYLIIYIYIYNACVYSNLHAVYQNNAFLYLSQGVSGGQRHYAWSKKINAHCNAITLLSCYFVLIRFVRARTALFMWLDKFAFLADSLSTPANDVFRHVRAYNLYALYIGTDEGEINKLFISNSCLSLEHSGDIYIFILFGGRCGDVWPSIVHIPPTCLSTTRGKLSIVHIISLH